MSQHEPAPPADSSEETAEARQARALDRQLFHLRTLYEAASELNRQSTPDAAMHALLPVVMGSLGATFGFGLLLHADGLTVTSRGLDPSQEELLRQGGTDLVIKFFSVNDSGEVENDITILTGSHLSHSPQTVEGTSALMAISAGNSAYSVIGLGPRLTEEPYSDDEKELLHGLAATLAASLSKGCADLQVRELNRTLQARNRDMAETLADVRQARDALDRRAFHLDTLYGTTLELNALTEPKAILNAFLLTLMGTFSYGAGWVGLYGPADTDPDVACRSDETGCATYLASPTGRDKVLARFVDLKDRMPRTGQAVILDNPALRSELPLDADVAVVFCLDNAWRGALGLSRPLGKSELDPDMRQLLASLMSAFIAAMDNAKHIEMIHDLNSDLAERNVELQRTLDELTSAREEIGLLTEAKERLVGLIQGEISRVWRASWMDVALIILAGVVLGGLFNSTSPSGIDLVPPALFEPAPPMVTPTQLLAMQGEGELVVVDARPQEFYKQEHIRGAVNVPKDMFGFVYSMKLSELDISVPIVVYGRTISRRYDEDVARSLTGMGHEKVLVLDGGLDSWTEAGQEVGP